MRTQLDLWHQAGSRGNARANRALSTSTQLMIGVLILTLAEQFSGATARGQIFATNLSADRVEEYNLDGSVINRSFITGLHEPDGITIFGADLLVGNNTLGTIGKYTTSGAAINPSFITGVTGVSSMAVHGTDLYVTGNSSNVLEKYNAVTGARISASFITGLSDDSRVAVSDDGATVFVSHNGNHLATYDAQTGALLNGSFLTVPNSPTGIVVQGSNLFVATSLGVGLYTTSGQIINASVVTADMPRAIAVVGNDLYVADSEQIGHYTTSGQPINPSLIPRLFANGIAVLPEPCMVMMFAIGGAWGMCARRRRSRSRRPVLEQIRRRYDVPGFP